jgi:hypothetical protein
MSLVVGMVSFCSNLRDTRERCLTEKAAEIDERFIGRRVQLR